MPARDPLSVRYDTETIAFLTRLQAGDPQLYLRGGFRSNAGVVSGFVHIDTPANDPPDDLGGPLTVHQRAFLRSMHYNFRAMFGTGRLPNGSRAPMPYWLHIDWTGPSIRFGRIGQGCVVRVGPEGARPQIHGDESYIDNPALQALSVPVA